MAANRLLNVSNQVRTSRNISNSAVTNFHGLSKSQTSLSKILHTISCFSEVKSSSSSSKVVRFSDGDSDDGDESRNRLCCGNKRGFGFDLNLRLASSSSTLPEINDDDDRDRDCEIVVADQRKLSECSVVGREVIVIDDDDDDDDDDSESPVLLCNGLSPVECEPVIDDFEEEEKKNQTSVVANARFQTFDDGTDHNNVELVSEEIETKMKRESSEIAKQAQQQHQQQQQNRGDDSETRDEGRLGLLIDAARLISGEFQDEECVKAKPLGNTNAEGANAKARRGAREWGKEWNGGEGYEEVSPVVRTKRGRSQVLPYRYRDSVIDPSWKQLQNKSSSHAPLKNKKRCGPFDVKG